MFDRVKRALYLGRAATAGADLVLEGRPHLSASHGGSIRLGDRVRMSSRPTISHIVALGGHVSIGDDVTIGHGAALSSEQSIEIGNGVRIGSFVVMLDSDFHVIGDRNARPKPQPITIHAGAIIGHRVTILRGSTIGAGACVRSGSAVAGEVLPGSTVGGVPARVQASEVAATDALDVPDIVARVLSLRKRPEPSDGPNTLPEWDSLGMLKLVLAIEQAAGITLSESELKSARSVGTLAEIVAARRLEIQHAATGAATRAAGLSAHDY